MIAAAWTKGNRVWRSRLGRLRHRVLRGAWLIRVETAPGNSHSSADAWRKGAVSVRRASALDGDVVARVALGREPLAERLARGELAWIAEMGGRPVGCTFLARSPVRLDWYGLRYAPRPHEAYHYGLHVLPDARRCGVALALSQAAIDAARLQNVQQVICFIDEANRAGRAVQRRLGGQERAASFVLVLAHRWSVVVCRRPRRGSTP